MVTPRKQIALRPSKNPNIPIAPVEYDQRYQDQMLNALRLYFNEVDNITQAAAQRIVEEGISFPDGTIQTTAWIPGSIEAYDRSATIALTATPTLLQPANFTNANGITYDPATGVFTFEYAGEFALSLVVNALASSSGQLVYIYAQNNLGAGWVNNANSGKIYQLVNNQYTQVVYSQAVTRVAGQQVRYYIYSNSTNVALKTQTLPTVSPTVYVPAIRIQYAG